MKFLKFIANFIVSLFKKVDESLKTILPMGIEFVNNLKIWIYDPKVDLITQIIPGTWDDSAVALVRGLIPITLEGLRKWNEFLHLEGDAKYKAILEEIFKPTSDILTKSEQNDYKTSIAATINAKIADIEIEKSKLLTKAAYIYPDTVQTNEMV